MPNWGNEPLNPALPSGDTRKSKGLSFGSIAFLALMVYGFWQIMNHFSDEWMRDSELTADGYAVIAKEYPALSPKTRSVIQARLNKGYLAARDTTPIYDAMLEDIDSITVGPAPEFGDPDVSVTQTLYNRVMNIPTQSKAKDLLLEARKQP
jgi:hypothetical protein